MGDILDQTQIIPLDREKKLTKGSQLNQNNNCPSPYEDNVNSNGSEDKLATLRSRSYPHALSKVKSILRILLVKIINQN